MNLELGRPYFIHYFESGISRDGGILSKWFQKAISNHLLHFIYANHCSRSGIYVAVQKADISRKLTCVVLYKIKQTAQSLSTRETLNHLKSYHLH